MRPIATRVRRSVVAGQIATQLDARRLRLADLRPFEVQVQTHVVPTPAENDRNIFYHRYVASYFFLPCEELSEYDVPPVLQQLGDA